MQEKVNIKNKYNKNLSLIIELPEGKVKDFIIISHCFTCSKLYKLYNSISNDLKAKGYGVARYDVMGLGASEGDFGQSSFSTNVDDLMSVYEYIAENYQKPKFLFGHSIGGLVSIKAANNLDSIKGVITVGSPYNFDNIINVLSRYESELIQNDNIDVNLLGRTINIGIDYLTDIRSESADEIVSNFNKEIIIFHSKTDQTVNYSQGLKLFEKIKSQKSFITLNNVDHLVSNKKDSTYISELLTVWLDKF